LRFFLKRVIYSQILFNKNHNSISKVMAKRKVSSTATEEVIVAQEVVETSSTNFFEQYSKQILYGVLGLALLFGAWYAYKSFVQAPKQKEAEGAMWQAQAMFERDSFSAALNNPGGGYDGFLTLADKYSGTAAGNTASYYAGISYLQLGDLDNAIKFLEGSSVEGTLLPITRNGALGDCYSEKKDYAKGISYYEKAVSAGDNEVLTPYYLKKIAQLNEYNNNKSAANAAYLKIKNLWPLSNESRDIDKYIARTK
jgi:TPR repeat protein